MPVDSRKAKRFARRHKKFSAHYASRMVRGEDGECTGTNSCGCVECTISGDGRELDLVDQMAMMLGEDD